MIIVDSRRGSGDLFAALSKKVPCTLDQIPAGDFAFEGNYEDGKGMIGVERKKITNDFITCMFDGRFVGFQLGEMCNYFKVLYLIIEGVYRPNKDTGVLEFWSHDGGGGWKAAERGRNVLMYDAVHHHLLTLIHKTPVIVERSSTPIETVQMVKGYYSYHNDKAWEEHRSHLAMHKAPKPGQTGLFRRPTLRRTVASDFPGVGWERAQEVEKVFASTHQMVNADIADWTSVIGIGKGIATKVYNLLRAE